MQDNVYCETGVSGDMFHLVNMLCKCKATFNIRWCLNEEVPCWALYISGEEGATCEFTFDSKGAATSVIAL